MEPLAVRMRPRTLSEVVGQDHLTFAGSPLDQIVNGNLSVSIILFAPPGTGKTTLATIIASETKREFVELSATSATVKDVRLVLSNATKHFEKTGEPTIVFLDEIHRFTKSQQDTLLPAMEAGIINLIGATTENPSFSVNSALVSRSILMVLAPLDEQAITDLVERAMHDPRGLDDAVTCSDDVANLIAHLADGDARQALNRLEAVASYVTSAGRTEITTEDVGLVTGQAVHRYDRDGDQHYDIISAFIKSLRGSDPDAALHWLSRMLDAGEDPRFIARRLIVHASEDVGIADNSILPLMVATAQACQLIGMPEARINLAHATIALALAPKSNGVIAAINTSQSDVERGITGNVPLHLRDAHYPGAKALGHGEGYLYPHDYPGHWVNQNYWPIGMNPVRYYEPSSNGGEARYINQLKITRGESS